jgi:hypothetical protein
MGPAQAVQNRTWSRNTGGARTMKARSHHVPQKATVVLLRCTKWSLPTKLHRSEANSCPASHEIRSPAHFHGTWRFMTVGHCSLLSQINPVQTLSPYSFNTHSLPTFLILKNKRRLMRSPCCLSMYRVCTSICVGPYFFRDMRVMISLSCVPMYPPYFFVSYEVRAD